jgi:hypothetical protein
MGICAICYNLSHFGPWEAYDQLPRLPSLVPNAKSKKMCKKNINLIHLVGAW